MEVLFERDSKAIAPVIDSWALMGSSSPMILIFAAYLLLVLKIGPEFMRNRKPMKLIIFTRCYNIGQVILCSWLVSWSLRFEFTPSTLWRCLKDETNVERLIEYKSVQWWFLLLRLAELIETVVFVLRKKQSQVSALHVYHHISTATIIWIFTKYCTSECHSSLTEH